MITWETPFYGITSRQQLDAFKALSFSKRNSTIKFSHGILAIEDISAVCYPNLKGIWFSGKFATGLDASNVLFDAVLENKNLELANIYVNVLEYPLSYHKLVIRSFVSATLRLLQIAVPVLPERKLDLFGKAMRFNTVLEELSIFGISDGGHRKYAKLLLNLTTSKIRALYQILLNKEAFFCTAIILRHSNANSFNFWRWDTAGPKRWWKHLLGTVMKLEHGVTLHNRPYRDLFSAKEIDFLCSCGYDA